MPHYPKRRYLCCTMLLHAWFAHDCQRPFNLTLISSRNIHKFVFLCLMLAPLDRVEIDTFLDQLPKRAQLAQECHTFLDSLQYIINFLLGRETANTETDAAVCAFIAVTKSTQNVAGLEGCRSTSTARRQGNILQRHQQRLAFDISERHVHASRVERINVSILRRVLHGQQPIEETVRKILDSLGIILLIG